MRYVLLCFLSVLPGLLMAQASQTTSGNWNNSGNWAGGNIGGTDPTESVTLNGVNSTIVNMDDYTVSSLAIDNSGSLTVDSGGKITVTNDVTNAVNTATLTVNGDMEVCGDISVKNNFNLVVGGNLRIKGDFLSDNGLSITVTGTLIIDGSLVANNTSEWTVPGTVSIGEDLDVKNNTDVNLPVGDFTVGGDCSEGNTGSFFCDSVLPITLISFNAGQVGIAVNVRWTSGTETKNDYYTIMRSVDGIEYKEVGRVDGAGYSNIPLNYELNDQNPVPGVTYYRLVQTDFDGTQYSYPPVRVVFENIASSVVYPNPVQRGSELRVFTGLYNGQQAILNVRDLQGRIIYTTTVSDPNVSVELGTAYESGVYLVELQNAVNRSLHRLVVE